MSRWALYREALSQQLCLQPQPVPRDALRFCAAVAALALLLDFGLLVSGGYHSAFTALNAWARPIPDRALQQLTYLGDTLYALTLMLLFARRAPQLLWVAFLAAIVATLLSHGLKEALRLPRPTVVLDPDSYRLVGSRLRAPSFPSGHATDAFTLACVIGALSRSWALRAALLALAALVGLSRIWVGVHWPVDVLTGAAIGAISAAVGILLVRRWHFGLRLPGHLLLVVICIGSAIALASLVRRFDGAEWTTRALVAAALASAAWHYLWLPLRAAAGAHRRRAAR
jgi:membrane-associated phospholipid phosphatase